VLIIYKHPDIDWSYYVVVKDDKTFLVWHRTGTEYKNTDYEMKHTRGNFKETSLAYNPQYCAELVKKGLWVEVTNILIRSWVRFILRHQQ
jgi:hypothetical protein